MNENIAQPLVLKKKSRSSRFSSWSGNANSFKDKLFRSIYIFLLLAIDFVMFIYSINGRLIEDGQVNQAVLAILGTLFGSCFILILLLSFSKMAQNIVCAVITMLVTVIFFYQFGLGRVDDFLEIWLNKHASWLSFLCIIPSPWIIGFLLGLLIFFAFFYSDAIMFIMLILLFSAGIGIQKNESIVSSRTEYQEVKGLSPSAGLSRDTNIVYLMIPKFPSYQFLGSIRDINFRDVRDLLIGFYVANRFEVYPNAFVQKNDTMSNIIDILNQVDYNSTTSASRGYAEFVNDWNFIHGGLEYISLEENQLYDYLKNSGFGVSMYAMPGFDFCLKSGEFYTHRCVVKGYKNVSLFDKKASLQQNVNALLGEWFLSLNSRDFRSIARGFIEGSPLRRMKVLSENRRVSIEGSAHIFERLSSDLKRDRDGQVYLVYVDLPSDIYIYDEYCNIKPRKDWISLKDNSLYSGSLDEKRKAYADQTKCLIGKMQEYMEEIYDSGKAQRTDVFIQGVSPIRELAGVVGDRYNRFVSENLVNLGIRKGKNPKFLINANVCLASDFTKTLIRYQDYCFSIDNMKTYSTEEALNLKKNLVHNSVIRGGKISNIVANYRDWYDVYKANSVSYQKRQKKIQAEREARLKREAQERQKQEVMPVRNVEPADFSKNKKQYDENIFVPTDDMALEEQDEEVFDDAKKDNSTDVMSEAVSLEVSPDTSSTHEETAKQENLAADEPVVPEKVENAKPEVTSEVSEPETVSVEVVKENLEITTKTGEKVEETESEIMLEVTEPKVAPAEIPAAEVPEPTVAPAEAPVAEVPEPAVTPAEASVAEVSEPTVTPAEAPAVEISEPVVAPVEAPAETSEKTEEKDATLDILLQVDDEKEETSVDTNKTVD